MEKSKGAQRKPIESVRCLMCGRTPEQHEDACKPMWVKERDDAPAYSTILSHNR